MLHLADAIEFVLKDWLVDHQRGYLDRTVAAMVVANAKWHELFTREERDEARRRLIAYE